MVSNLFLSMGSTIFWFLVFAVSCGMATFIESYYNTATAWALVYGTAWFGLVQIILAMNLAYNIYAYKLFQVKKIPALLFHISFIFILIGAGLTRYIGTEGVMHIRNGDTTDKTETSMSHIQLTSIEKKDGTRNIISRGLYLSKIIPSANKFELKQKIQDKTAILSYKNFIPNAVYTWQSSNDEDATAVLELVFSDEKKSRTLTLTKGDKIDTSDLSISFNADDKLENFIDFSLEDGKFFISTDQNLSVNSMNLADKQILEANKKYELNEFNIYTLKMGNEVLNFTIKTMLPKAKQILVKSHKDKGNDILQAVLKYDDKQYPVDIVVNDIPKIIETDDIIFFVSFNPVRITLPFSITLDRFELLRYAGSHSPMSYSSYVRVNDEKSGSYDYHIYMNHVLDHGGYRFFQSSYDMDEQGTILSVNQDPGKWPTYFGYFLLGLGFFLNLINPYSRFSKLSRLLAEQTSTKKVAKFALLAVFLFNGYNLQASENFKIPRINKDHLQIAKTLIIQNNNGVMKTFDTLSSELLNKLYRSNSFYGLQADEAILSMIIAPAFWVEIPIIKVNNKTLKEFLGIENKNYASFKDFFNFKEDGKMEYKLLAKSEEVNRKPLSARGILDKEIAKVDEKINILYMIFEGEFLRIFPDKNDKNNAWYSANSFIMNFTDDEQRKEILSLLEGYFLGTEKGISSNDWQQANEALIKIKEYQAKYGADIMPSQNHIKAELIFNKYNIFKNLIYVYFLAGFALLIVVFTRLVTNLRLNAVFKVVYIINILAFVAHTSGLILRWYISGHAPWSDSYESLVYIAWALALSGIVFSRRSAISLALTAILAGCTLFVAHLSWIDPQVTNLQPVLKSYWLTIHVSVITASYGFLGLCSLLGIFSLLLFSMQGKKENSRFSANILEATRINEMAMILGLSLLTFGNFLGGVWANESWGRYWGWDSKETWALISILVYAAVLHMRFVKKLNSQYAFGVASMFAYWVIIFTYFGVNFYLTGLHSYAAGDAVQVPIFVYVIVFIMIALSLTALRGKKYSKSL